MNHISEIINKQIASKKAFTQSRNHGVLDRSQFQKFHWELYPLMQDYYHELNPFFVTNLYKKKLFDFSDVITVRDGKIAFANFLVNNVENITSAKTHFLIPSSFSDVVPATLKDRFSCWHLSQKKKVGIESANRVIIFGILLEKYIGPVEKLEERIAHDLKRIRPDAKIEILLSQRHDPFAHQQKESLLHFTVFDIIRKILPERELTFVKLDKYLEGSFGDEDFLYDLKYDDMIVSDSYLSYFFASRGATVNTMSQLTPLNAIKSLKISFFHEIHVSPFKFVTNEKFSEMIFYKRLNAKNLIQDKNFHRMITSG